MSTTVMPENSRPRAETSHGGGEPERGPEQSRTSSPPKTGSPSSPFVGHAMRALFESSDVSIRRGDETRVMSRAHEALAEIQRKTSAPPPPTPKTPVPPAAPTSDPPPPFSSRPPGPRVDAVLWIVLAAGIFAIAGWMIAYAL